VATGVGAGREEGKPVADAVETKAARFLDTETARSMPLRADTRRFLDAERASGSGIYFQPTDWQPE